MKKTTRQTRLVLRKETIKALLDEDLVEVEGGVDGTNCTAGTKLASGCSEANLVPQK